MTDASTWQGGDLRHLPRDVLDLGTCVNRHGPPPSVRRVLAALDPATLRAHPYEAEAVFTAAYARHLGVPERELLAGRGITEFLHLLATVLDPARTAVLTPDYTDSIRLFPNHLPGTRDNAERRLSRLADAMARHAYVLTSNPNNPLGLHIPPDRLAEVCRAHPASTLVVDEAYVDFTADGPRASLAHARLPNTVVLCSPNKPFGIAGARTGALWTPNRALRTALAARRLNWPLSQLDVLVATAALTETGWAARTRAELLATAGHLEELLVGRFPGVVAGVPVHYRFVALPEGAPHAVHAAFLARGVAVRVFSGREPGRVPGIRVTAPTAAEFPAVADALGPARHA